MDKRILAFWLVVLVLWAGWFRYLAWRYPPPPEAETEAVAKVEDVPEPSTSPEASGMEKGDEATEAPAGESAAKTAENQMPPAPEIRPDVPLRDDLELGTSETGSAATYEIFANLSNHGAVVTRLQLNRYQNEARDGPFILLEELTPGIPSFALALKDDLSLAEKNWEILEEAPSVVSFATTGLDGRVRIVKRFELEPASPMVRLVLQFQNLTDEPIAELVYTLTGGNGLPIEGAWYTYYYRDMVTAMVPVKGAAAYVDDQPAGTIADAEEPIEYANPANPIQFTGIATQYFASLVVQPADPITDRLIASARSVVWERGSDENLSNVGVVISGTPIALPAKQSLTRELLLYNGPKDTHVLADYAEYHLPLVIHYRDFLLLPIGHIARFMVWILGLLHSMVGDYGVAIILLTVVVRSCMFPLSFKQTMAMQKMQELQPQMEELKKKYGNDKQKLNQALMELYSKNKVNPLGGCLPIIVQLPIFIGLYQALSNSFSLRQSSFLYGLTWIKDLAAPDQLFGLGVSLPLLGPYFNLLPVLAVGQMLLQARYFSPPAATPEAEMQKKMMNYMMIFFGVMFYRVPAGLCVYFITSGSWSMLERKLLPKSKTAGAPVVPNRPTAAVSDTVPSWKAPLKPKRKSKKSRK